MNNIIVSIIIATYNRKKILIKCIESLLKVDFPRENFEIIVGDGGSTDSTQRFMLEIIKDSKKFPNTYPNIRYIRGAKNLGAMGNKIDAFKASRGKYICTIDSDVIVPENWLKSTIELMESKDLDVSGGLQITDTKLDPFIGFDLGTFGETILPYRKKEPLYISTANAFFKKTTLLKVGGFDHIIAYGGGDLDVGIRMRLFGGHVFGNVNTIVDHTYQPSGEDIRAPKNRENLMYFIVSRVIYTYLKNFEWRYGIFLAIRHILLRTYDAIRELINKDIKIFKGYLRALFWISLNFGNIFINHGRIKRNVKSSIIFKKFFHPKPISIKRIISPGPTPYKR